MLQSDRQALVWGTLSLFAVLFPFAAWGAIDGDWGFAIAGLLIPILLGLFLLVCMRIRLRVLRGLIARRSPLIPTLPDYAELRERGLIPDEWTPTGPSRALTPPMWLVMAAGILLPWFLGAALRCDVWRHWRGFMGRRVALGHGRARGAIRSCRDEVRGRAAPPQLTRGILNKARFFVILSEAKNLGPEAQMHRHLGSALDTTVTPSRLITGT
jgi:hypothetical protein